MRAERAAAIAAAAEAWRDPDHPARAAAVEATLAALNRYTVEGLAFAINHAMHAITAEGLDAWAEGVGAAAPRTVGLVAGSTPPLSGLREWIGVALLGHRVLAAVDEGSPALLPAFAREVQADLPEFEVRFVSAADVLTGADALVLAEGAAWPEGDLPDLPRFEMPSGIAVAVLGGREGTEARSGLAEDLLLHDGTSPRSVGLVWAPEGLAPDPYLDAMAGFRELFPPHADTDGGLRLPAAFLAATKQPHAVGPGFLLSKGAPEPQAGGHVRWAEYADAGVVERWLEGSGAAVALVLAEGAVAERLRGRWPVRPFGDAHRPRLFDTDEAARLLGFLAAR